ncbi:MAG: PEP-CTERM sorting domain-containing protein [Planctomycetota bacterium]|jgi:hypothetical protein
MRRLVVLSAVLGVLIVNCAVAEDYNPPDWRGDPGTTFQQWEFSTFDGTFQSLAPDKFEANPLEVSAGTFSIEYDPPDTDWAPTNRTATGVWRLESPSNITIELQNFDNDNPLKEIWMQLTFAAENQTEPFVSTSPFYTPPMTLSDKVANGDYWNVTYHIIIEPNPASETIWIQPTDCTLYIDEVVIDTICVPEPMTIGLLGLGALALLRKRRA